MEVNLGMAMVYAMVAAAKDWLQEKASTADPLMRWNAWHAAQLFQRRQLLENAASAVKKHERPGPEIAGSACKRGRGLAAQGRTGVDPGRRCALHVKV